MAILPMADLKCRSVIVFRLFWREEKSSVLPTRSEMGSMMEPPWNTRKRKSMEVPLRLMSGERRGRGREGRVTKLGSTTSIPHFIASTGYLCVNFHSRH